MTLVRKDYRYASLLKISIRFFNDIEINLEIVTKELFINHVCKLLIPMAGVIRRIKISLQSKFTFLLLYLDKVRQVSSHKSK